MDLPDLGGGCLQARRISGAGHVAGSSAGSDGVEHPLVWRAPDHARTSCASRRAFAQSIEPACPEGGLRGASALGAPAGAWDTRPR